MTRRRRVILFAVLIVAVLLAAVVGWFIYDDPATPPAELHRITVGMPLAEVVKIMGSDPSDRGFPGADINIAAWESPRGLAMVYLDRNGRVSRVDWNPS